MIVHLLYFIWYIGVVTAEFTVPQGIAVLKLDLNAVANVLVQRSIDLTYTSIQADNLKADEYPWKACYIPQKPSSFVQRYHPLDEGGFVVATKTDSNNIDLHFVSNYFEDQPYYTSISSITTGIIPRLDDASLLHVVYVESGNQRHVLVIRGSGSSIQVYNLNLFDRTWYQFSLQGQNITVSDVQESPISYGTYLLFPYKDNINGTSALYSFAVFDIDFSSKRVQLYRRRSDIVTNTALSAEVVSGYRTSSSSTSLIVTHKKAENGNVLELTCDMSSIDTSNVISCVAKNSFAKSYSESIYASIPVEGGTLRHFQQRNDFSDQTTFFNYQDEYWVPKYNSGNDLRINPLATGFYNGIILSLTSKLQIGTRLVSENRGILARLDLVDYLDGKPVVYIPENRPEKASLALTSTKPYRPPNSIMPRNRNLTEDASATSQETVIIVAVVLVFAVLILIGITFLLRHRIIYNAKFYMDKYNFPGRSKQSQKDNSKPEFDNTNKSQHSNSTAMTYGKTLALPGFLAVMNEADLSLEKKVAEGGGGVIYSIKLKNSQMIERCGGSTMAVAKVLKRDAFLDDDDLTLAFNQEISVMWLMNQSDYIVKLLGYCQNPKMIVMKYYQLGSFYELVHKKTNHIPENKWNPKFIMNVAHDIACGLMDMHAVGLVHCDIKPGNIFLEREANGELKAVVGDLGVATAVDESLLRVKAFRESRIRGASVAYAPPEVLRAFKDNDDADLLDPQIAKASDVYAYSMVIHEALTRKLVWDKLGNDQIERLVLSGQRPKIPKSIQERRERDTVLDLLCTIMSSAWAQFPKDRPTFTQIVKDLNRMKSNVVVSKKAKKNEDA